MIGQKGKKRRITSCTNLYRLELTRLQFEDIPKITTIHKILQYREKATLKKKRILEQIIKFCRRLYFLKTSDLFLHA